MIVPEEIISTDLCLYDIQKAALGGVYQEFILSARLDNLMLSFCSAQVCLCSVSNCHYARPWSSQWKTWMKKTPFEW